MKRDYISKRVKLDEDQRAVENAWRSKRSVTFNCCPMSGGGGGGFCMKWFAWDEE